MVIQKTVVLMFISMVARSLPALSSACCFWWGGRYHRAGTLQFCLGLGRITFVPGMHFFSYSDLFSKKTYRADCNKQQKLH